MRKTLCAIGEKSNKSSLLPSGGEGARRADEGFIYMLRSNPYWEGMIHLPTNKGTPLGQAGVEGKKESEGLINNLPNPPLIFTIGLDPGG